jgi:multiple sugar transport system substrate-binding protein
MKSMKAWATVVAAVALMGVAACGGGGGGGGKTVTTGGDDAAAGGKPVNIVVWHGQNQTAEKVFNRLVTQFNASHPRIHVDSQVGTLADAMLQKVTAALAGGKYPDMAFIFGPNVANLARSPKALDLTAAVKQPGWNWDDFFPAARTAVTIDGKVRAVPAIIDSMAIVYNKKLFAQAGVAAPEAGWTWDDSVATATKLTNSGKGVFGTGWPATGDEDTVWRIWPMVWGAGGDVVPSGGSSVGYAGAILGLRPSAFELDGPRADASWPTMRVRVGLVEHLGDEVHASFDLDAPRVSADAAVAAAHNEADGDARLLADDERAAYTSSTSTPSAASA